MSTNDRPARARISTCVEPAVLKLIERLAEQRRTTPAQVARVMLEDAAREVAVQVSTGG